MTLPSESNRDRGIEPNANAIIEFRKAKGYSQEKLAAVANCTTRTVRNAEKGSRVDSATLHSIADALGITLTELLAVNLTNNELEARHIEIIKKWALAFASYDIEATTQFHDKDIRLELPGTKDLTGSDVFIGLDAVKDHLRVTFETFELVKIHKQEFFAAGQLVFHRSHATSRSLENKIEFTAKYFNEFEFKDEKIVRRTSISDLSGHRTSLGLNAIPDPEG